MELPGNIHDISHCHLGHSITRWEKDHFYDGCLLSLIAQHNAKMALLPFPSCPHSLSSIFWLRSGIAVYKKSIWKALPSLNVKDRQKIRNSSNNYSIIIRNNTISQMLNWSTKSWNYLPGSHKIGLINDIPPYHHYQLGVSAVTSSRSHLKIETIKWVQFIPLAQSHKGFDKLTTTTKHKAYTCASWSINNYKPSTPHGIVCSQFKWLIWVLHQSAQ
jgi:hypothetical protein